jgi:hypothetical protein
MDISPIGFKAKSVKYKSYSLIFISNGFQEIKLSFAPDHPTLAIAYSF